MVHVGLRILGTYRSYLINIEAIVGIYHIYYVLSS